MAGQNQGVNLDLFETYFKRADLDGDGRVSGAEAVAFFKGSNLSQQVLAQIWTHADQSRTGFLGRAEFYNALKLVTVAQSKRELTPDIVKAALYGPAAAKIPPPQINLPATPAHQINALAAASTPQMGAVAPTASQNLGFRGPGIPNASVNQHHFTSQQSQMMRPPQATPLGNAPRPSLGVAGPEFSGRGLMGLSQPMPSSAAPHPAQIMSVGSGGFPSGAAPRSAQTMPVGSGGFPSGAAPRPAQTMPVGYGGFPSGAASRPAQTMPVGSGGFPSSAAPRPAQTMPVVSGGFPSSVAPRPAQTIPSTSAGPGISNSNISTDWLGGRSDGVVNVPRSVGPSPTNAISQPENLGLVPAANDSKASAVSGNGFAADSFFGGDVFSAAPSSARQGPSVPNRSVTGTLASSVVLPVSGAPPPPVKSNSLDSLQSAFAMQPLGAQHHRSQSLPNADQQVSAPSPSSLVSSGLPVGAGNSLDNSQVSWPKMKPSDVQKYTKVFVEVDTDRDGRITGEQARNLFLSWRLPREILKQVWDLSDQDNDSMLSLREFCFALYLMERHREGRPLPSALPSNVMYNETLLSMTGQPKVSYGNAAWAPGQSLGEQPGMGARSITPATNLRPPIPVPTTQPDGVMGSNQPNSKAPVLDDSFLNQRDSGEQNSLTQNGTPSDTKVNETEKIILDSREKIEFYRSKMQDLVLYKSRCDNRLNEITERAIADKREAEMLGKKYEEKYKQVAEVASKLTIEEATFRDTQERKLELNQAIVNMERGGSADGLLQVRADRIQSDLDELIKVLTERSKKHGLDVKSTTVLELPFGWQPGIQEGATVWDEDWDKFEDEGFSNDLTIDMKDDSASSKLNPDASHNEKASPNFLSNGDHVFESESAYAHSEDESAKSPQGSPAGRTEYSDVFAKSSEADAETHSRSFDESTWGAFDGNDDVDSVWGFNPSSTKDQDSDKQRDFYGSDDFGVKPIRTESPTTDSIFQKKSPFFEDSVPATPMSRFGNSPRYSEAGDHFDNFSSGFDSYSMHEGGFSPREKLSRFDSINSSKDFGSHSRAFSSFDDTDPFGSSGPFKVSSDNQTPKKSDSWSAF